MRVSVIGPGAMGAGMASSTLRAGHATSVQNRSRQTSELLRTQRAAVAAVVVGSEPHA